MTEEPSRLIDTLERSVARLDMMNDPTVGVGRDFSKPSTRMLITFAPFAPQPRIPGFLLFQSTMGLPVKRLFVRDPLSIWYQRGVPGFGDTIDEAADNLRAYIEHAEIERLVAIGPSAGGYAALLFGTMLGADVVLSFSPQANIDREWFAGIEDERAPQHLERLDAHGGHDEGFVDLREALPRERRADTICHVHYGVYDKDDVNHAQHLAGLPGIVLHEHEHPGHYVLNEMVKNGEIKGILDAALEI